MTEEATLEDILDEKNAPVSEEMVESQPDRSPEESEPSGEPSEEKTDASGEKNEGETPAPDNQDDAKPPLTREEFEKFEKTIAGLQRGISAERHKRQEAQKSLSDSESRLKELQQGNRQQEPTPVEFADPEGAAYLQNQMSAALAALNAQREQDVQALREEAFTERVTRSVASMESQHSDYQEMEAAFEKAAEADPSLVAKALAHPDPARFVYEEGQRLNTIGVVGTDLSAYREQLRKELLAEIEADGSQQSKVPPKHPKPPKTLAGVPSTRTPYH